MGNEESGTIRNSLNPKDNRINFLFYSLLFGFKMSKIISKIISKMENIYRKIYTPPFDISKRMLTLVGSISEKIGKIDYQNNWKSKPHLRRSNRIQSIHSSLHIEANSLSLSQVKDVIDGHAVFGDQREIQEVKNAYDAYAKIDEIDPFSLRDLKTLHAVMTKYLVDESGKFRSGEEGVFDGEKCIFMAPPARRVPELMSQLFSWMKQTKEELHPLILSSVFHYEFVFIHPFEDGNGRMARLWQTVLLTKWKPVFEFIPIESAIEKCQDGYYDAISTCHKNGNSNMFIEFMLQQIDLVLEHLLDQISLSNEMISPYMAKMLETMERNVPYSAKQIMQLLNLKSKETFRKHYMNPALELGAVKMTIPDKPTSRNQRYIKI